MNTYSVTDLRHKTNLLLEEVANRGYISLVKRSKPTAALVDLSYFSALLEAYEDYLDILEFDATTNLKRVPLTQHKSIKNKSK